METLQVERDGGIVTVTLNKPQKKNAVDPTMWVEMARIWDDIARNPRRDRAVVVTGAGGDFCSGADLWLPPGEEPPHQLTAMRAVSAAIQGLHDLPQPTIAKVPGVAAGAGCSLALACDLIVAGDKARFAEIFPKRGLALDGGSSWLLPRLVGLHRAKELAFFGDIIGAAEAERIGLVNRVVPDAELDEVVTGWAERLASGPPVALAQTKRLLNESMHRSLAEALDAEGIGQLTSVGTEDAKEAVKAFLAKREPTFRGR